MASTSKSSSAPSWQIAEYSPAHDIFLSHSGAQKPFVEELYKALSPYFSTFLDVKYHSLPLGEHFPTHILHAARSCKLAVVVLSEEFVCSYWPMVELSTFVESLPTKGGKILPLFFKLSPPDLRNKANLKRWSKKWKALAKQKPRIVVSKWEDALKTLGSHNGLTFNAAMESELAYMNKVVAGISQIVPPTIRYNAHHVQGKDRLCKVILDKFKEMDAHQILQEKGSTLPQSSERPKVLGLYGLPGSGKSTLCKILKDHFFCIYGGKSMYMELPTNPNIVELVNQFKLLLQFTDFRDRVNLDISDIEQVEGLLRGHQLKSYNVFLAVDNISDESWEAVQRILHVGFGPGSRIILVARTFAILHPLLKSLKQHCICDHMRVPSIDEGEAKKILLQTYGSGSAADGHLSQQQTEIIMRVVRLCGFGPDDYKVYLPLVMKIVGGMLVRYQGDLEEWENDQKEFWTRVSNCKEDAVKKLAYESFKALPDEKLQVLFMDVALFIRPSKLWGLHDICTLLGFMHERSASRMEQMMKDLERYCFLTVHKYGVIVHDVFLEFAKSMQEDAQASKWKWIWGNEKYTDHDGKALLLKGALAENQQVRTMILEVKGCEEVELQSFLGLKAVVVRGCPSLEVLRLEGLSSLVSLEIGSCASLQRLECSDHDYSSLRNVRRLLLNLGERRRPLMLAQKQGQVVPLLGPLSSLLRSWLTAPSMHSSLLNIGIAGHMKGLQILRLGGTGIRRLGVISNYWPQLQDLSIRELHLQSLEVGNLPRLKRFHFNDSWFFPGDPLYQESKEGNQRFILQGKNLLMGCPELEDVRIASAFIENGELPDISSSSHTLEKLTLNCCKKLEKVNFLVEFRNLTHLHLEDCSSVVEVRGSCLLPSLHNLHVQRCPKLRVLVGFDNSKMLKVLFVKECQELEEMACLGGLMGLEQLEVWDCPNLTGWDCAEFEKFVKLRTLSFPLSSGQSGCISLKNFSSLENLELLIHCGIGSGHMRGLFEGGLESLVSLGKLTLKGDDAASSASNEIAFLDFLSLIAERKCMPVDDEQCSLTSKLQWLSLERLPELACTHGIQHLVTLTSLTLMKLENLTSLQGLGSLIHLTYLRLEKCPHLAELPSLHALVKMQYLTIGDCPKIQAVEGCDGMRDLRVASFSGCENLSCLPFSENMLRDPRLWDLDICFEGCKFAESMERVVAWAVEEETPRSLRLTSIYTLQEHYWNKRTTSQKKEQVVDMVFPILVNRLLPHGNNDCFDFQGLLSHLEGRWNASSHRSPFPRAAVQELMHRLQGKPKKDLLQNSQIHKRALLRFLDDVEPDFIYEACELTI